MMLKSVTQELEYIIRLTGAQSVALSARSTSPERMRAVEPSAGALNEDYLVADRGMTQGEASNPS